MSPSTQLRTERPARPPTMEDVAARAGVSRALVSIVFRDQPGASEQTRARVRAAADEIGYRMDHRARLLSSKQTRLIGVGFGVGHEFHAELITELYAVAGDHGYELVLSGVTRGRDEGRAAQDLLGFRCDAVLLLGSTARPAELAALGRQVPTVLVARAVTMPEVDVVRTDDVRGAVLATEHLIALGHTKIIHIDGGRAPGAAERRRGYQAAMRSAGLRREIAILRGGLTDEEGSAAAEKLLPDLDRIGATAVTVFNDQSAIGFLSTVRAAGVEVPNDLSLVGYDDSRVSRAGWSRLTTIGQDTAAIARSAVERVIARIDGEPPGPAVLITPTLIERATTGRPGGLTRR